MTVNISKTFKFLILIFVSILSFIAAGKYPGNMAIYLLFTLLLNSLFFLGLRKNAIFFDLFLGGLFWLGYWLKLSIRLVIENGGFSGEIGAFDRSPASYDKVLLTVSCGVTALLIMSKLREKLFFCHSTTLKGPGLLGLFKLYHNNKKTLWTIFIVLFMTFGLSNMYFGIYQRGTIPRTILPYKLSGIFTWFLLFGASTITALFLNFESFSKKKNLLPLIFIGALEGFFSYSSMLSRGMVLNMTALALGLKKHISLHLITLRRSFSIKASLICICLFTASLFFVNHLRIETFSSNTSANIKDNSNLISENKDRNEIKKPILSVSLLKHSSNMSYSTKMLFIDRWVGIEAVMAVSSYPQQGWPLWKEAWKEKFHNSGTSLFDKYILVSSYVTSGKHLLKDHHFISLPGILAFMFYPGSYIFLFFGMLLIGAIGASIEFFVYKLSEGNIILCSLISQVVAYRFAHFGYVPNRSYLLFGSILINILLIYLFNKVLIHLQSKKDLN